MRRFVVGDIHGAFLALQQCLKRSSFNKDKDQLICLGDLADGWPHVVEVFDELTTVKNLVLLLGNHDQWLLHWFNTREAPDIWLIQGGHSTINAFGYMVNESHVDLLRHAKLHYTTDRMFFVHGGFDADVPLETQEWDVFLWDRSLVRKALAVRGNNINENLTQFDMVYVGHTPTIKYGETKPIISHGICMMDTGAGWPGGVLTLMDIDTKQIFQSDPVDRLYKNFDVRSF